MSDPQNFNAQPRGAALWIGVALVLSLAVNTFLVGTYVGGRALSHDWGQAMHNRLGSDDWMGGSMPHEGRRGDRGVGHIGREFDPRFLMRLLPVDAREEAMEVMQSNQAQIRELLDVSGQARFNAFELLHSDEFDEAALREAFEISREADQVLAAAFHETLMEIMGSLTPEQRVVVEQRLDEVSQDRSLRRDRFERRRQYRRDGGFEGGRERREGERRRP